jgi:glycosyltransferase involved in cell wall biosynthesis
VVAPLVAPLQDVQAYGNHRLLVDLARALAARGHDVTVSCAEGSAVTGVRVEPIRVDPCLRRAFVLLGGRSARQARAMRRAFAAVFEGVRRRSADVVSQHAFDPEAFELAAGVPAVHTLHLPPMDSEVVAAARCCAGRLVAVSQACGREWRRATSRDVDVLPNGVPDLLREAAPAPAEGVALVAGRVSREKGVAGAVRASRRVGLRPVVVGDVYDPAYYRSEVEPLLDGGSFLPTVPRAVLLRMMSRSAVTLMPVEWEEPFGLVAAEAQLAGCPVAGYRRGALPEVIEEGVGGYLAPPGDEAELDAAIRACLGLDRRRVRESARRRFGMEECASRYERLLAEAAGAS